MNNYDNHDDLLADLIAGRLPEERRVELESQINANPELKSTLAEMKMMAIGLRAMDSISAGHVDSKLLVTFCDSPGQLDAPTREEITLHLAACADCREEAALCRKVVIEPAASKGLFYSAVAWFFSPRLTLRPAIVAAFCILLALPVAYHMTQQTDSANRIAFSLESTSRDILTQNKLEVSSHTSLVQLNCVVPSIEGRTYRMELCDSSNNILLIKPDNPAQNLLALDIPTSYLQTGSYKLRIVELGSGALPTDTLEFTFRFHFTDK